MGTISRQTTWATGDTLTASDLNGEFDNILSTANGSLNADNLGVTAGQAAASKAVVLDSNKDFADTSSGNQIRNLTISGSLKIGTTFLPDASGGADLGSTSLEWGDVYIADDKKIYLGSDQDISLQYDETTNNALEISAAVEGAALGIVLKSDQGDDAGDEWKLNIADGGTLTLGNDIASAGSYVTHLTLTPNSTVSSSTLALAGGLTVAGTAGITGVATVGGLTIGSAVINEAELETIDGITAGTVAASKAVVVDSNKDIGTFRNITIDGTFSDGNYTFDTSGNVSGLGTIGSGAITSTGVVTATGFTIGSAVINEAELETIDGVTAGTVAASKAVVVDSNKDIGSFRNVTLTGELDAATLDISGNADIDGTTNLDAVDIDGAVQVDATITVGADDQGYDIIFYGDTASANMTWDTSADDLILNGGAGLIVPDGQLTLGSTALAATAAELNVLDSVTAGTVAASKGVVVDANKDIGSFRNVTLTGELDAATLDISGNADIDGTTNLDAVDIDGAVQVDATITVGVDDTGYDVKFFGATSGSSMLWDESADDLILTNAGLAVGSDATGDIYYRDSNGFLARLGVGSNGQVLTTNGTIPSWGSASGSGDFSGPGSATDNAIVRFNGTGGKTGQNSGVTIDDSNNATGFANLTLSGELDAATGDFSGDVDVDGTLETDALTIGGTTLLANDSNNRVTTATGSGTLNGEANLTYDGQILDLNHASSNPTLTYSEGGTERGSISYVVSPNELRLIAKESGSSMSLQTANTEAIYISSSQQVGIGTSSPSKLLHVDGATDTTDGTDPVARFERDGSSQTGIAVTSNSLDGLILRADSSGFGAIHSYEDLGFYTGVRSGSSYGDVRMRIDSATGNVGIGTTGPTHKLVINTSTNHRGLWMDCTNASQSVPMTSLDATRAANSAYSFLQCLSGDSADAEFLLRGDGEAYADGSWNGSGADYQEFFESADGSALEVGKSVVMDGDKVRVYNASSDSTDNIIGVVRPKADNKNSAVIGNTAWNHWTDKYLTDDWGVYLREDLKVWEWDDVLATESDVVEAVAATYYEEGDDIPEGKEVGDVKTTEVVGVAVGDVKIEAGSCYERDELAKDAEWTPPAGATSSMQSVRKRNPDYDEERTYSPREERDEWNLIGLLGQVQIKANEATNPRWIKMKQISDSVDLWLVR